MPAAGKSKGRDDSATLSSSEVASGQTDAGTYLTLVRIGFPTPIKRLPFSPPRKLVGKAPGRQ